MCPAFTGQANLCPEEEVQDVAPTPMLTANPPEKGDRLRALLPHARRRSVVLDVGSASDYTRADVRRFGDVYERPTAPHRPPPPHALRPPAALAPATLAWIRHARPAVHPAAGCPFSGERQ